MWEANWLNDTNPPINELTHHGIKGMQWGVRRERIQKTPEQKAALRTRRKRIRKYTLGLGAVVGTVYAGDVIAKHGYLPVKSIAKYTIKGTVKISDSKSPATLAGKLAVDAITNDYWNKTFTTLSNEIDEVNALTPEARSEELRKVFNKT